MMKRWASYHRVGLSGSGRRQNPEEGARLNVMRNFVLPQAPCSKSFGCGVEC